MCKYSVRLLFCDLGSNLKTFIHSFKDINTYIARKNMETSEMARANTCLFDRI